MRLETKIIAYPDTLSTIDEVFASETEGWTAVSHEWKADHYLVTFTRPIKQNIDDELERVWEANR